MIQLLFAVIFLLIGIALSLDLGYDFDGKTAVAVTFLWISLWCFMQLWYFLFPKIERWLR